MIVERINEDSVRVEFYDEESGAIIVEINFPALRMAGWPAGQQHILLTEIRTAIARSANA